MLQSQDFGYNQMQKILYLLKYYLAVVHNFPKKLKSIDIADKIYMYQKTPNTDMKKILKKNKDFAIVLNPLLKVNFTKKTKVDQIGSSYLSEMGYIFKTINND